MKNCRLIAWVFLILTASFLTSCDKEPIDSAINLDDFNNDQNIPQQQTGDTFFAKVGGVEFVDVAILPTIINVNGQEFIRIVAQNQYSNSITISVKSNLGVGIYPITGTIINDNVQAIFDYQDTNFFANSGSIKIASKTATRMKGTFNFITNGATPFTISEGAFDVEY